MRINYLFFGILAITLMYSGVKADTIVTNDTIGISVYLPDNWVATSTSDSSIIFSDSTLTYRSQIAFKRYKRNTTDYPSIGSWTRAHLISYMLVANYSFDPFGAVLYFDSSAACVLDSRWAPEAFSEYYSLDTTLGAWDEYMRYTETTEYGYELYAIGDTTDMKENIGLYMGIISMIEIKNPIYPGNAVQHHLSRQSLIVAKRTGIPGVYDLLGKRHGVKCNVLLNGIYYRPETGTMQLLVK